jgi:hypothetical protein
MLSRYLVVRTIPPVGRREDRGWRPDSAIVHTGAPRPGENVPPVWQGAGAAPSTPVNPQLRGLLWAVWSMRAARPGSNTKGASGNPRSIFCRYTSGGGGVPGSGMRRAPDRGRNGRLRRSARQSVIRKGGRFGLAGGPIAGMPWTVAGKRGPCITETGLRRGRNPLVRTAARHRVDERVVSQAWAGRPGIGGTVDVRHRRSRGDRPAGARWARAGVAPHPPQCHGWCPPARPRAEAPGRTTHAECRRPPTRGGRPVCHLPTCRPSAGIFISRPTASRPTASRPITSWPIRRQPSVSRLIVSRALPRDCADPSECQGHRQ